MARVGVRVLPGRVQGGGAAFVLERTAVLDLALELLAFLRERGLDRGLGRRDLLARVAALRVVVGVEIARVALEIGDL